MATSIRHKTLTDQHVGRPINGPADINATQRQTTNSHTCGSICEHDHNRDNNHDHDTDVFNAGTRTTHSRIQPNTYTRTPAPIYRQSTTRAQRTSTREQHHDNPFQDQLLTYKTQLVDTLNAQMDRADDEITQHMDELSEEFDGHLKVIEEAGGKFWAGLGKERVKIGVLANGGGNGQKCTKEIALEQVMIDLEELMDLKRARLKELTTEYTRVRADCMKLAIAILGEEKVSLVSSESSSVENNNQRTKTTPNHPAKQTRGLPVDIEVDTITASPTPTDPLDQVYTDAESGLTDLQTTLDDLESRILEENKGAFKAFQAGRKVKHSELSKLLNTWSLC